MGIPVFTDRSSYENHPLGRTEWIKVYAEMVDKRDEAKEFFDEQAKIISDLKDFKNTEKTVAFFYINTDGSVVVRKPSDYVPKMIEIAGGRYVPTQVDSEEETKRSSVPMTMEEFYTQAIDADYLVYNGTIDDPINSVGTFCRRANFLQTQGCQRRQCMVCRQISLPGNRHCRKYDHRHSSDAHRRRCRAR